MEIVQRRKESLKDKIINWLCSPIAEKEPESIVLDKIYINKH